MDKTHATFRAAGSLLEIDSPSLVSINVSKDWTSLSIDIEAKNENWGSLRITNAMHVVVETPDESIDMAVDSLHRAYTEAFERALEAYGEQTLEPHQPKDVFKFLFWGRNWLVMLSYHSPTNVFGDLDDLDEKRAAISHYSVNQIMEAMFG